MEQHAIKTGLSAGAVEKYSHIELKKILRLLKNQTGYDFSYYKPSIMMKRIEKRLTALQLDTLSSYLYYLHQHPNELDMLFKRLLTHASRFFRDTDAFEQLKGELLTHTIKNHPDNECFRVWVPACSTGEEAYSIAILIQECMSILNRRFEVRIFATDICKDSIETARTGLFSKSIEKDISHQRLQEYFMTIDEQYYGLPVIRNTIVFAVHDIVNDAPIAKLNLLCCRNMLFYLEPALQEKLMAIFHSALNHNGLLFLGSYEKTDAFSEHFSVVNQRWRIYKNEDRFKLNMNIKSEENAFIMDAMRSKIIDLQTEIEELSSIYEESHATNEEIESLNTALIKLNVELENRYQHLSTENQEMKDLLDHCEIATLFLDKNLHIKQYTKKVTNIIHLIPTDLGRPVAHLESNLIYNQFFEDATTVLRTQEPFACEVFDKNGCAYRIKMSPYVSESNNGIVVTFLLREMAC